MNGGTITSNTARAFGGGVFVDGGTFSKTGGTITGHTSDQTAGNVVRGNIGTLTRRGHAVFVNENRRRETTAGTAVNLSCQSNIGWDN